MVTTTGYLLENNINFTRQIDIKYIMENKKENKQCQDSRNMNYQKPLK